MRTTGQLSLLAQMTVNIPRSSYASSLLFRHYHMRPIVF